MKNFYTKIRLHLIKIKRYLLSRANRWLWIIPLMILALAFTLYALPLLHTSWFNTVQLFLITHLVSFSDLQAVAVPGVGGLMACGFYLFMDFRQHANQLRRDWPVADYSLAHHARVVAVPRMLYNWRRSVFGLTYGVVGFFVIATVLGFSIQSVFAAQGIRVTTTAPDSAEYGFSPRLVARDGDNNILVGDTFGSTLRRYSSSGQYIGSVTLGTDSVNSLAVSSSGDIYVTDSSSTSVKKYSAAGVLLDEFGSSGTGDGQFTNLSGIALDSLGNIFVADDGYDSGSNHRIQKFDSDGTFITKWGTYGTGDGQFRRPAGIAVDVNNGNTVFVTDLMNHRVQKFDNNGSFLAKWGSQGSGDGQFQYPYGITIDDASNVFIADVYNYRVQKFNNTGGFVAKWGSQGSGDGQLDSASINALASDADGNIYYADYSNYRVQQFNNLGVFQKHLAEFPVLGTQRGVEADSAGNIYVADSGNKRIVKYDSQRRFVKKWSVPTTFTISGLAIDSQDRLIVAVNSTVPEVLVYDAQGTLLDRWGSEGSGDGQFSSPGGIAVGPDDSIYVLDKLNQRIQKFDNNGTFITKWGSEGSGDGQFSLNHWVESANGIAVDGNGNVFVSDTGNHRIQKFDNEGNFITKWGTFSDAMGGFKYPRDLDIDSSGAVYVLDTWYLNRIQKFDNNGNLLSYALGSSLGIQAGQSENMSIGPDDTIYVTNDADHNIKLMRYETWLSIATYSLPYASYGNSYSANIEVDDPAGAVTYSIVEGALPEGLSLDGSTGEISGDPVGKEYSYDYFTVRATDGVTTAERELVIGTEEAQYIQLQDQSFNEANKNQEYTAQIYASPVHGQPIFSITQGSLPTGLSLDNTTGQITGTPTVAGSYIFTISVQDSTGQDSHQYIIAVGPLEADISVETVLGSPGLSPGQQSQYTITYTNTGPNVLPPDDPNAGVYSLILIPSELTRLNVSASSDTTCYPYPTPYPAGLSQYQGQGELLYCARSNTSVSLGLGEARSIIITVQSSAQVTEDTTMKVASFGLADPDQQVFNTAFGDYQDVYSLNSNSICNYKGMSPGSCLDDVPSVEIKPDSLPHAKYSGDMYDVDLELVNAPQGVPVQFSVIDGELPKGLTLSDGVAAGRIYGDPFSPGTWTFTLKAERSPDYTSYPYYSTNKTYTITVDPANAAPSFSPFSSPLVSLNSVTRVEGVALNSDEAHLSGTGPPDQIVEVYVDNVHFGGVRAGSTGAWNYVVTGLSKSAHQFSVKWEPQQDIAFATAIDTNALQSKLLLLDSVDKSLIKKISLPPGFFAFESQINHSGTKAYIAGAYVNSAITRVLEYDIASGAFINIGDFYTWQGLSKTIVSDDDRELYVLSDQSMYVVDLATMTQRTVDMSVMHADSDQRYGLVYGDFVVNASKTRAYIVTAKFEGSPAFKKLVTEVDLQTGEVTTRDYGVGALKESFNTVFIDEENVYAVYGDGTGLVIDQNTNTQSQAFSFGLDYINDFDNNYSKQESTRAVAYNPVSHTFYASVYTQEGTYYSGPGTVYSYSLMSYNLDNNTVHQYPAATITLNMAFNSQHTELFAFSTDPDYQSGSAWFYSFDVPTSTFSNVATYANLMPYSFGSTPFVRGIAPPVATDSMTAVGSVVQQPVATPTTTGTDEVAVATPPSQVVGAPDSEPQSVNLKINDIPAPIRDVLAPSSTGLTKKPEPTNVAKSTLTTISKFLGVSPRAVVIGFPWMVMALLAALSLIVLYKLIRQLIIVDKTRKLVSLQELLNHEKKSLLSLASHYLRTPLTILAAGVDTLPNESKEKALVTPAVTKLKEVVDMIISKIEGDQGLSVLWKPDQPIRQKTRLLQAKLITPLIVVAGLMTGLNILAIYGAKINPGVTQMLSQALGFLIVSAVFYTLYDIRNQKIQTKDYEAKLLVYEEALDQARNQFIKDVSNDLVPAVIDLDSTLPQSMPETAEKYLKEGLRQLEHTIENFILVSQLEKSRLRQNASEFKVAASIESARKSLEETNTPLRVRVPYAMSMKQPEFLLRKVLSSLIANAAEHSEASSPTEIYSNKKGSHVKINVMDHGSGIEPEKLSLLFKPLSRVEEAEDFTHQGMGLSLYVNRLMMHYMGGEISARSKIGDGTTMTLDVPISIH